MRPPFGIHHAKTGGRTATSAQFEPLFMTHPLSSRVCLSMDTPRRDVAGHTLSNSCKKKGNLGHGRSWKVHYPGQCWPRVPLRTSSRLRRRSTRRATKTCCARTAIRGRSRPAVLTLSSNKTGPVPLELCLVRCSVKLWRGPRFPDVSPNDYALWGLWESLVAQENPMDATTPRAAIVKTHAKITGDQIKRMIWHFHASPSPLPSCRRRLLRCFTDCVELV